ncbi:MAG TPA: trypsin-like serine protease [Acidimicrobiia bacterium]|nr:trypsin-like serine protease [Acidimicrobiia bacterium]
MKRRSIFVIALALLMALAGAASAITWGEFDGEEHPHVVNLLFVQNGVGYYSCTGTLLTPTVVLTAGHCTGWLDAAGDLHPNEATYVTNAPDINQLIAETRPNYDTTIEWLEAEWISGQAVPHPEYADFAGFPDTFDIGLVLLDDPMNVSEYGELPTLGQFDYLAKKKTSPSHRMVEVVGYGLVGRIPAFSDDIIWERRVGYSTIINTGQSANAGEQNFVYSNNPGNGNGVGGTCSGDSGGPAFWIDPATGQPTNLIVGVNSYGIAPNCNGNDYQFRTDTAAALDFVSQYLP